MMGIGRGRTYKVKIDTLLGHLKKNREEHVGIVEEAQAAFREKVIARLDRMLTSAKAGEQINVEVGLRVPTRHTDAFDNAIGLLEMTKEAGEDTIEIDSGEYERFVRNCWEWTGVFAESNRGYSSRL